MSAASAKHQRRANRFTYPLTLRQMDIARRWGCWRPDSEGISNAWFIFEGCKMTLAYQCTEHITIHFNHRDDTFCWIPGVSHRKRSILRIAFATEGWGTRLDWGGGDTGGRRWPDASYHRSSLCDCASVGYIPTLSSLTHSPSRCLRCPVCITVSFTP